MNRQNTDIFQEKQEIASQQEILQQYNCTINHHLNKPIEGICLNEICKQQNRRTCFDCIIDRIHDNDNGKQSLIRNADQVELIIEKVKKFLNNQIDTCQFQLYYQQLKICEETSDFVANKMLEQLNKMDYDMNLVQSVLQKQRLSIINLLFGNAFYEQEKYEQAIETYKQIQKMQFILIIYNNKGLAQLQLKSIQNKMKI